MIFLIDHNLEGQALILLGNIVAEGWLDLLPIRFVKFKEIGLPIDSSDQAVWRFAQANQMILITANRSMKGERSLEQVIREENMAASLPVVTIGSVARLDEREYRELCINRLIEIALYIENYTGAGRLFVP